MPAWHGVGYDPPWSVTGAEFDRRTRQYFHGTTTANAKRLLAEQRPDPSMYGSRTDYGFFGEGFYHSAPERESLAIHGEDEAPTQSSIAP